MYSEFCNSPIFIDCAVCGRSINSRLLTEKGRVRKSSGGAQYKKRAISKESLEEGTSTSFPGAFGGLRVQIHPQHLGGTCQTENTQRL